MWYLFDYWTINTEFYKLLRMLIRWWGIPPKSTKFGNHKFQWCHKIWQLEKAIILRNYSLYQPLVASSGWARRSKRWPLIWPPRSGHSYDGGPAPPAAQCMGSDPAQGHLSHLLPRSRSITIHTGDSTFL